MGVKHLIAAQLIVNATSSLYYWPGKEMPKPVMPALIRLPVIYWIAQKLHCVSRLSGNDEIKGMNESIRDICRKKICRVRQSC